VPAGSPSGAAVVVAAGEADVSIGTDTGGSVRIPAALCGVVGYKPSYGAVSTDGVWPLSPSLDHVGYLVADVDRLAAPAHVLALASPAAAARPPGPRRLGVAVGAAEGSSPAVRQAFDSALDALRGAGFDVVGVDWPGGEEVFAATTAIMYAEAAFVHRALLPARHHLYGVDVRARLLQGLALDAVTYLRALEVRQDLRRRCLAALTDVEAVLTPTVPIVAPLLAEAADPAVAAQLVAFTRLADVSGLPALSLPIPGQPLPVGLQLEGALDADLLALAPEVAAALSRI
jgi:aspartyl-tRNA(Asn)/glutamyl-tRNA(Gln) amidotransferase subunit A